MVYGVIYLIRCLVTGKLYVGQTTQKLKYRIGQHKRGKKQYIDRAIQKYGWSDETFKVAVLEECDSRGQLDERECYWIAKLNCKYPNGYNMTDGGDKAGNSKHTPEHNAKIAAANRGVPKSPEHCAKLSVSKTLTAERLYSPYLTLAALLTERVISYTELAKAVGITQEAMSYKMCGKHQFSLAQMETIRAYLGVNMPLEELFRRDDGSVPDMTPKPYVYPVLAAILQKRKITFKQLAKVLGVDKNGVSQKMRGLGNFTPAQMEAIKKFLGVEMSTEELFKRNE